MRDEAEEARRSAWGDAAKIYADAAEPWTSQTAAALLAVAQPGPRGELLELGCATGAMALAAQNLGALVTAIDIAPGMITAAQSRPGGASIDFRIGDMRALDARAGGYDAVVANFSLIESGAPEAALKEAFRALRPGGRLVWTAWPAPTGGRLFEIVDAALMGADGGVAKPPKTRGVESERAVQMTQAAGFTEAEAMDLRLWGAPTARVTLTAHEALDAAETRSDIRGAALDRLAETLGESDRFWTDAVLIAAQKPREGQALSTDDAPTSAAPSQSAEGGDKAAGPGGLIGRFRRWMGRS